MFVWASAFLSPSSQAEEKKPAAAPVKPPAATPPPKAVTKPPAKSVSQLQIYARAGVKSIQLIGPEARQQLIVTDRNDKIRFRETDVTGHVIYSSVPPNIVAIDKHGFLSPLANGKAKVTAHLEGAKPASIEVTVEKFAEFQPVSFPNDIVPIFTRNECNVGACHAKAAGQNGFQLSLFGYNSKSDFDNISLNARGRRVSQAAPEHSLILMKASGDIPHSGGARLEKEGGDYKLLRRWIESGMAYAPENDPVVTRIEAFPKERVAAPGTEQQLCVTAFFDNGTTRDITHAAQYESNQEEMAEVDEHGLVSIGEKTSGSTSVLIRFQEQVDVFTATVPMGKTLLTKLPKPRNFVDEKIFEKLVVLGIPPSKECDDATFVRRVTLDIAGRLPTLEETGAFLKSTAADKRKTKIDSLLAGTDYADYFAGKWAGLLRNKAQGGLEWVSRETYSFHGWIRSSLIEDKPFDQLVSELVTASGRSGENPAVGWYRAVADPKDKMQDIAQVFLGIRMQCAQCHHHPYEKWSQDDYYGLAAFFTTMKRKAVYRLPESDIVYHNRKPAEMKNPATGEMLKPTVLGGKPLDIAPEDDPRHELAKWLRSPDNPYFSRMVVNRYWKHFFSRGMVEPEDDIRATNPPSHPQLLNGLSKQFVENGFDLKDLIRTICNSRTYQFSADPLPENTDDEQNYARFYPRRMQAETLLDSMNDVMGVQNAFSKQPAGVRAIALPDDSSNQQSEFLTMFGRPQMDSACECERTGEANLGQSLHLINSDKIQVKLSNSSGRARAMVTAKDLSDDDRLRELYLRAVSRPPNAEETGIAKAHLKKKRDLSTADPKKFPLAKAEQEAFEDILWVLTNTKEFLFNH